MDDITVDSLLLILSLSYGCYSLFALEMTLESKLLSDLLKNLLVKLRKIPGDFSSLAEFCCLSCSPFWVRADLVSDGLLRLWPLVEWREEWRELVPLLLLPPAF